MISTDVRPRTFRKGWEQPASPGLARLTHAARRGSAIAACGVILTVFGEAWAAPSRTHPESRCAICSQSVSLSAMGDRMG
jgi:hypothetical protein